MRVTDILSELTRQLSPLERQSETARIYLAKRDTLRELDVNSFLLENEETSRELKELDTKNTRLLRSWRRIRRPTSRRKWNMIVWKRNWNS